MKDRRISVIVLDAAKYNELTASKRKEGDKVKHELVEVDELNKYNCIKLTLLQEKLLARKISKQEQQKIEVAGAINDLLISHDLLPKLIAEVQKNVAGEKDTILTIGLNACGRLVKNASKTSYNIIPNDESGAGKDYTTENTLKVFTPEENLIVRTRISPKVMNYWHNSKFEPEWNWDGRVLYLKDVSDEVLNSEVMKTFTSDQTTATILINQMAIDLEIRGKPCVFCTTANSTPGPEQLRRFSLVPLDSSEEQTKKIKEFHAKRASEGAKPERDETITEAMKALERVSVTIPYSRLLAEKFPNKLIVRTLFGTFVDLIKASAALHQFQREKDSKEFVLANFQDYEYARQAFKKITDRGGLIPVTKNQKRLLEIIDREMDKNQGDKIVKQHQFWAVPEIEEKVAFLNRQNLYANLGILANNGFLKKGDKEIKASSYETSGGESRTYSKTVAAYCVQETDEFVLPAKDTLETEWMHKCKTSDTSNTSNTRDTKDTEVKNPNSNGGCIFSLACIPDIAHLEKSPIQNEGGV